MGFFGEYPHGSFYRKEMDQIYDLLLTPQEALCGTEKEIIIETGIGQKQYFIRVPPGVGPDTRLSLTLKEFGQEGIQFRVKII